MFDKSEIWLLSLAAAIAESRPSACLYLQLKGKASVAVQRG